MQNIKQLLVVFSLLGLIQPGLQAQNYQINFTGSGLSTTVGSIQVLNLTQGTTLTLGGSDVLNLVGISTSIATQLTGEDILRIFPNPMTEKSEIEFSVIRESLVNIEIFDITGKIVIRNKQYLIPGIHKFEISGLNKGIYLVNVIAADLKYVEKLLSTGENSGDATIRYLGNNFSSAQKSALKSTKDLVPMPYNDGERLLLMGISGNYSRVLTLVPTQDQTVNFEFIACTDALNNHYPVITLGTQTWMAANLAYLPSVSPSAAGSLTDPHYYVYGYQGTDLSTAKATANYQTYGVLYNWPAAMNSCPTGWHLPTDAEWTVLENYLIANGYNYDGTTTGNKIAKSLATSSGWTSHTNIGAVGNSDYPAKRNASGFSALPGGYLTSSGAFSSIAGSGFWWSSTESSTTNPWGRGLLHNYNYLYRGSGSKQYGFYIRCLRD